MITTLVLWSHALAALSFGALALAQVRRPSGQWPHAAFVIALAATSLWALAVAGIDTRDVATRIVISARDIAWLGFMLALVRRDRAGNYALGAVYFVVMALAGTAALLAIAGRMGLDAEALRAVETARTVFRMMSAVSGLVLIHHLYQAAPPSRGGIRLVVLALAAMWGVDLFVSAGVYFAMPWIPVSILVRGVVMTGVAALLVVGVHRSGDWTLALSRPITARALSAVALIVYAGLTALATSIAASYAGSYVRVAQTAIVFGATAAALTLLSTPWLRAWTKVKVAKHLFRHRYDYRAEWQRFTDTLGKPAVGADSLHARVVKSVADLTDSPGGLLLVHDGASLGPGATWNWFCAATGPQDETLARFLAGDARIVELDRVRAGTAPPADIASVPAWLHDCPDAWAIVPLMHGGTLAGAIVLARPPVDRALDWEDFDLLRVAGRQAASYLAEDRAHAALADAARFDEFNRRFAFILHDIKNLVSQLTLVARNAERHADNPEFRIDMVATLKDSSDRMNALLARLSQHGPVRGEPLQPVEVAAIVERVATSRRGQHPIAARAAPILALGHAARLEQVLGHLVQNAIEASGADDPVLISVEPVGDRIAIDVIDHGVGMAPGFVRDQLFRPFVSSKPTGFGIGAFEAQQLVHAMGGALEVVSREGEGTRFRVLLPAIASLEAAA
ncbi:MULTISPECIES: XrtA/PEP-CTERM system histidine kinase PrsK [Sphingomonas]|uniref:XrtA/PEP-CTERM system histidine kinase PrsK n=1 Tax=Sphingomonas TaxID=13687 RepID=UPI0020BD85CB|nr:XrtA/PEP-CTERM system histidine kinase PrsK [Sphingomonas faeni]MCK8457445.1 PEP-CTERM system histidine kinase PrsK [Sphingomonas faeni]